MMQRIKSWTTAAGLCVVFGVLTAFTHGTANIFDEDFSAGTVTGCSSTTACLSVSNSVGGYCTDISGALHLFPANTPRVCSGTGLLVEPSATNLVIQNVTFSGWSLSSAGVGSAPIITTNYTTAPDGSSTASRVQFALNGGDGTAASRIVSPNYTVVANALNQYSVYIKNNTSSSCTMLLQQSSGSFLNTTLFVQPNSMGWQRFVFMHSTTATSDGVRFGLVGGASFSDSCDLAIWGAQVEQNPVAPTSVILTTTTSATRPDDIVSLTGTAAAAATAAGSALVETDNVINGLVANPMLVEFSTGQSLYYSSNFAATLTNGSSTATAGVSKNVNGSGSYGSISDVSYVSAGFDSSTLTLSANNSPMSFTPASWGTTAGATIFIGNHSVGGQGLAGYIKRLAFSPIKNYYSGATPAVGPVYAQLIQYGYTNTPYQPFFAYMSNFGASGAGYVYGTNYSMSYSVVPATFPAGSVMSWWWGNTLNGSSVSGVWGYLTIASYGNYEGGSLPNPIASKQISTINTLNSTLNYTIAGQTQFFDIIHDIWLTDIPNGQSSEPQSKFLHEIEINWHPNSGFVNFANGQTRIGAYTDANGIIWQVSYNPGNAQNPPDIYFYPTQDLGNGTSYTIDIKAMFNYLISRGTIAGTEYYSGHGLGVEPSGFGGSITINSASVVYN